MPIDWQLDAEIQNLLESKPQRRDFEDQAAFDDAMTRFGSRLSKISAKLGVSMGDLPPGMKISTDRWR